MKEVVGAMTKPSSLPEGAASQVLGKGLSGIQLFDNAQDVTSLIPARPSFALGDDSQGERVVPPMPICSK